MIIGQITLIVLFSMFKGPQATGWVLYGFEHEILV